MVNVLVIGATGYIGQAVSQSLIRSGDHRVYGLARTPSKAKSLEASEVTPIIGAISDSDTVLKAINHFRINIVLDVSGAMMESHELMSLVKKAGADRLATASKAGVRIPKLGYIYCSGSWVHGSSNAPVNDLMPVGVLDAPTPPAQITSWRTKLEGEILVASDVLDVMVVRPALVYGRSCGIWSSYFEAIQTAVEKGDKVVTLPAETNSRPGLIHVDDIASGFHAAIDKLPLISGTSVYPIFDLITSQESMRDIFEAVATEFGFKGKVELGGSGDDLLAKAISSNFNGNSGRARQILGWEAKRIGFVQNMDVFARSWAAARL